VLKSESKSLHHFEPSGAWRDDSGQPSWKLDVLFPPVIPAAGIVALQDGRNNGESERPMRMKPGIAAFVAVSSAGPIVASLGGCASTVSMVSDPFVAPQKFQYLRCEDIAKRLEGTRNREQELRTLMDRSSAGTGGSTVNLLVYQPDYRQVTSELQQLKEAQVEKQCPPEKADSKNVDAKK
jgi:hypothetical protein